MSGYKLGRDAEQDLDEILDFVLAPPAILRGAHVPSSRHQRVH
jgi:hypothetical protein